MCFELCKQIEKSLEFKLILFYSFYGHKTAILWQKLSLKMEQRPEYRLVLENFYQGNMKKMLYIWSLRWIIFGLLWIDLCVRFSGTNLKLIQMQMLLDRATDLWPMAE